MRHTEILAPTSVGDLIDKITILRIKSLNFKDSRKTDIVIEQLGRLADLLANSIEASTQLNEAINSLSEINSSLWDLENTLRQLIAQETYNKEFVETVRAIVENNTARAKVKRSINTVYNSYMAEQKEYC